MIGCNDSLKNAIKKVKSELIYPDKKHMFLFIGSSGVGKSFFVQTLFEYVKERNRALHPYSVEALEYYKRITE